MLPDSLTLRYFLFTSTFNFFINNTLFFTRVVFTLSFSSCIWVCKDSDEKSLGLLSLVERRGTCCCGSDSGSGSGSGSGSIVGVSGSTRSFFSIVGGSGSGSIVIASSGSLLLLSISLDISSSSSSTSSSNRSSFELGVNVYSHTLFTLKYISVIL